MLQAALKYLSKGFSVIPCKSDKRPYIQWEPFQKRQPTEAEIRQWWLKWPCAMIGIVTGAVSGIVVIDIDTPEGQEAIQEYIPDSIIIPTCHTPSGGQHLYFKCPEKPISNNARLVPGCDFRGQGGYVIAPPSSNGAGAYQWLDGMSIEEVELPDLPEPYLLFINSLALKGYKRGAQDSLNKSQQVSGSLKMFDHGRRDEDLFHTANCLVKGGMPQPEVEQVLERLIISWGENPDPKWIKTKIESALKRAERRERNIAEEVRRWVEVSEGIWQVSECLRESQIVSKDERHAVILELARLARPGGPIERYGDKRGFYRKVQNECDEIDFLHASDSVVDISWPFGIERYFKTLPKNIIVVAGEPDAGKTAFLLNTVRLNMDKHKVFYFSSEMGPIEMRARLSKFDLPLSKWNFIPKERSSNFSDVIIPDGVNLVDFLEMTGAEGSEFYKIGAFIKNIYDKLQNGIAIIAIQKNRELALLKHMFTKAVEWRKVRENPARDVKRFKGETKRLRYLMPDEVQNLLLNCGDLLDGLLKPIVTVAVHTGMRKGEILGLEWNRVNFEQGVITLLVSNTKNSERRDIPMDETVKALLRATERRGSLVFPGSTGNRIQDAKIQRALGEALKMAGIDDFRFHDLRHTFASNLAMQEGVELNDIRELLGHKDMKMTLRYAHLSPRHKTRVVNILDRVMSQIPPQAEKVVQLRP